MIMRPFSLPSLVLLLSCSPCSGFTTHTSTYKASRSNGKALGSYRDDRRHNHDRLWMKDASGNSSDDNERLPKTIVSLSGSSESGSPVNDSSSSLMARRSVLCTASTSLMAAALSMASPMTANAATSGTKQSSSSTATAAATSPVITDKVQFNIRVSRPDGSFYVRDDDANEPSIDRVFYCRIVVGLYGKDVPNHVQRFLSYCIGTEQQLAASEGDSGGMSYASSMVTGLDPATGLLQAGVIPSLRVTLAVAGTTTALEYRGRLVPASLWLDAMPNKSTSSEAGVPQKQPLSHVGKGLLTHARLDVTPSFGITTRSDMRELDATHQVFGRILFDESEGAYEFLDRVRDLPTYSLERPVPLDEGDDTPVEAMADAVFTAQRNFFRKLAKDVGDSRLDKVYPGKFLRRIEVTQVSKLK